MIYVSTIAINQNEKRFFEELLNTGYGVEFSSGGLTNITSENIYKFKKFEGPKILHNYFPCYDKEPFVLNLASQDEYIRKRSIKHAKMCVELTADYASEKIYAIHAGFNFELKIRDLGKKIEHIKLVNPNDYFETFIDSMIEINNYAKKHGVKILIENNVLIPDNYKFGEIPFLCVESEGVFKVFNSINDQNISLLLDTAHLKVSCKTLGLDLSEELMKIKKLIKGIHHSDNNGLFDSNSPIDKDYWFLEYKDMFDNLPQTLEVKCQDINKISKQIDLLN